MAHAYFFFFPKLKPPMKGAHFAWIEEIKKLETRTVGIIKKGRFRSVSMIGKYIGISVLYLKGATLKGTK